MKVFPKVESRLLYDLERLMKDPDNGLKEYPPTTYLMHCDRFVQKIYRDKGEKKAVNFEIFYFGDNVSIVGTVETEVGNNQVRTRVAFDNDNNLRDALYICLRMSQSAEEAFVRQPQPTRVHCECCRYYETNT